MKVLNLVFIGCLIGSISCTSRTDKTEVAESTDFELMEVITVKENIETVCYVCHSPTAAPDDRLAPPLEIAKRNYLAETETREEFIDKMVQFILNPTAEQSVLHSDVEQYGLMDPVGFSEEDIRAIAEYVYDNELERPDWLMDN